MKFHFHATQVLLKFFDLRSSTTFMLQSKEIEDPQLTCLTLFEISNCQTVHLFFNLNVAVGMYYTSAYLHLGTCIFVHMYNCKVRLYIISVYFER